MILEHEFDRADVLPDSRLGTVLTPKRAEWRVGAFWVPIFCASCGVEGGKVPEENMTFAFWLCQPCFAKYGVLADMMVTPDEVFYEKLKQEQLEAYGRFLTAPELIAVVEADATPLATLIQQGR
ncbi:MAG: hypothetical protein ABIO63_02120 [Casimicrobiaceae bacterium]